MSGSIYGNVIAALVFIVYQGCGVMVATRLLQKERRSFQILLGSVIGSVSLQWLPVLFAFFIGFNVWSNVLGLVVMILGTATIVWRKRNTATMIQKTGWKEHAIWLLILPVFCYFVYVVLHHTISVGEEGLLMAGQSTYGDMNLHLSIITSIANQGTFPPEYSILPGTKLSYPFLCNSISSSLYVFGATLRFAYILPMLAAVLQCFYGFYVFIETWLKKKIVAVIAWVLFFFNGGFGFFYFMDGMIENPENFGRIFTAFYETPTNYIEENVRWSNIIVDMLIPQRATLFGWAVLFPVLALLYKAVFEKKRYYLLAGLIISALPMIHTHSFLTMAVVCATWCFYWLLEKAGVWDRVIDVVKKILPYVLVIGLICMELFRWNKESIPNVLFVALVLVVVGVLVVLGVYYCIKAVQAKHTASFLSSWGILLIPVLVFALPQLMYWTFQQASGDNFIQGNFNWSNGSDSYIWFYIKNMGLMVLLLVPALIVLPKKEYVVVFPALLLWFVAEFVQFQPNPYDNNKLLYPAYGIFTGVVAWAMVMWYEKSSAKSVKRIVSVCAAVVFVLSAVLTMGREAVSEYQLYSESDLIAAEYIEFHTEADSIILTNTRHNNAISSLTGRNVVCGPGTFLYFHGVDYSGREYDVELIYEDAITNEPLIAQYEVDYIVITDQERYSYPELNEAAIASLYPVIFESEEYDVTIYQVIK